MPMVINGCYRRKRNAYVLFALFMGLCSMLLFLPTADAYRHAELFYEMETWNWDELLLYLSFNIKVDFILFLYEFGIIQLGLTYGFVRFGWVVIAYLIYFYIYDCMLDSPQIKCLNRWLVLWMVILVVPIGGISSGLRYGFAATLISLVLCRRYLLNKTGLIDYIIIVVAIFVHFATIFVVPLLVANKLKIFPHTKKNFWIFFVVLFLISSSLSLILQLFPLGEINNYLLMYTEGKYSDTSYLSGNVFFWLPIWIGQVASLSLFVFFILYVPINHQSSIMYNLFLLWAFTSNYSAINGRVQFFFYGVGVFYLLYNAKLKNIQIVFGVFLFSIITGQVIGYRKHTVTRWPYLFAPYPVALQMDYDVNWIYNNVDPNTADLYLWQKSGH